MCILRKFVGKAYLTWYIEVIQRASVASRLMAKILLNITELFKDCEVVCDRDDSSKTALFLKICIISIISFILWYGCVLKLKLGKQLQVYWGTTVCNCNCNVSSAEKYYLSSKIMLICSLNNVDLQILSSDVCDKAINDFVVKIHKRTLRLVYETEGATFEDLLIMWLGINWEK